MEAKHSCYNCKLYNRCTSQTEDTSVHMSCWQQIPIENETPIIDSVNKDKKVI